jgi:hypothetical protein
MNHPDAYEPEPWEVVGFDIAAYRQEDGSLEVLDTETVFEDGFPEKVRLNGVVYGLKGVKEQDGNNLCWGQYA